MDGQKVVESFRSYVEIVEDPRDGNAQVYSLDQIILMTLLAALSGAENWVETEQWAAGKSAWVGPLLELPESEEPDEQWAVPAHDTFGRVFGLIDPEQLREALLKWTRQLVEFKQDQIAIDGKSLRRAFVESDSDQPLHTMGAWASGREVVLCSMKAEGKDEVGTTKQLIDLLEVEGAVVTLDALGCQRDIARKLSGQQADYLLRVRGNQGNLYDHLEEFFEWHFSEPPADQRMDIAEAEDIDGGHGRVEVRRGWWTDEVDWLETDRKWCGLASIACVESTRHKDGKTQTERKYYICSRDDVEPETIIDWSRSHWEIENRVHWVLDVAFDEDQNRARTGHSAENLAMLRRMALNLLRQDNTIDAGIQAKRKRLGWDHDYMLKVLAGTLQDVA